MTEISKFSDELFENIYAFSKAILNSPEYQKLIQCDEALDNDPKAQDLLRDYRLKQLELQRKGFDRGILAELNDLETQLKSNETLASLESSQKAFAGLLKSSNEWISEKIGMSFAQVGAGCR